MKNWYKISFIFSCILWGLIIIGIIICYFKSNQSKIKETKDCAQTETIEEESVHYAPAENCTTFESVPFFEISESDRYTIECIVAGESKGESIGGKKLVAQCIMNAMIRNDWDAETVRIQYKYAGWDSELENTNPELWGEVEFAVSEVFDKGNLETYEPILYFYAPKWSSGSWHENNLEYVLTEGGHKFFKLKGE